MSHLGTSSASHLASRSGPPSYNRQERYAPLSPDPHDTAAKASRSSSSLSEKEHDRLSTTDGSRAHAFFAAEPAAFARRGTAYGEGQPSLRITIGDDLRWLRPNHEVHSMAWRERVSRLSGVQVVKLLIVFGIASWLIALLYSTLFLPHGKEAALPEPEMLTRPSH